MNITQWLKSSEFPPPQDGTKIIAAWGSKPTIVEVVYWEEYLGVAATPCWYRTHDLKYHKTPDCWMPIPEIPDGHQ